MTQRPQVKRFWFSHGTTAAAATFDNLEDPGAVRTGLLPSEEPNRNPFADNAGQLLVAAVLCDFLQHGSCSMACSSSRQQTAAATERAVL